MFEFFTAIILGIVEGFTEFLPISSTGHLVLLNPIISFSKNLSGYFTLLFDIVIQLGAILAVVFYFGKRLWPFTNDKSHNKKTLDLWTKAIVGVLPAIILGALFASKIEEKLFNPQIVAIALFIGGVIILLVEKRNKQPKINSVGELTFKTAFYIGLIQCLAMIPGTSRSGATIIGAMILGVSRIVATEFSFFLAIPTMVAASAYSLLKYNHPLTGNEIFLLATGFITSFIVALLSVKFLVNYIKQHNFKPFGWYRIVLGVLIIVLTLI